MLFKNIKKDYYKFFLCLVVTIISLIVLLIFIINDATALSQSNQDILQYIVRIRDAVEELDKVFERAEVNVNVMTDSISNSYDVSKQYDKAYNLKFVEGTDGLVKSILSNSPNIDGAWFQLNADLPFSVEAYNWFEFKENQFINIKDQFEGTPSMDRKITPEDDPYYFSAIANQKPTWSDIYVDADTKDSMMTISSPVYKEDELVGVAGIDISTDNLQQILKDMRVTLGNPELYLLNKKNSVILSQLYPGSNITNVDYSFLTLFNPNEDGVVAYSSHFTKKTAIILTLSNGYKLVIAIKNKDLFNSNKMVYIVYVLFILLIISTIFAFINQSKLIKVDNQSSVSIPDETIEDEKVDEEEL